MDAGTDPGRNAVAAWGLADRTAAENRRHCGSAQGGAVTGPVSGRKWRLNGGRYKNRVNLAARALLSRFGDYNSRKYPCFITVALLLLDRKDVAICCWRRAPQVQVL